MSEPAKTNISILKNSKSDIWIVEDYALLRECLAVVINEEPDLICSHTFSSCEEALKELESSSSPSVILLDIGLPGMSGLDGIQKFKDLAPSVQIIMITVFEDNDKVFQAICAGASGYLLKTTSDSKIIEAVYDVLNGGSPMNAQIARKVLSAFASLNPPLNHSGLSDREAEILQLMIDGLTMIKISEELNLSYNTIDTHIRSIYYKLHVNNRSSAVAKAIKEKLL